MPPSSGRTIREDPSQRKVMSSTIIGFEINHLQVFCQTLAAAGVKFEQPFSEKRHKSFPNAELVDPWGTSIELTEGLSKF